MQHNDFPDIYLAADKHAAATQRLYFRLLWAQYFCLFFASLITLLTGYFMQSALLVAYFGLLVTGAIAALMLATAKPNEKWYGFRALAESSKTVSWRYMMGAAPFDLQLPPAQAKALFADRLHELVAFPGVNSAALIADKDVSEQSTPAMQALRDSDFATRKAAYLKHRIDDQMMWYKKKAAYNQKASKLSLFFVVAVYVVAIGAVAFQIYRPFISGQVLWVSEPLLVLAASLLGFAQAKRYAELSASYALTALEIQKLRAGFIPIDNEAACSAYVIEAEDAFSREHTQWIAKVI